MGRFASFFLNITGCCILSYYLGQGFALLRHGFGWKAVSDGAGPSSIVPVVDIGIGAKVQIPIDTSEQTQPEASVKRVGKLKRTPEVGVIFSLGSNTQSIELVCHIFAEINVSLPEDFSVAVLVYSRTSWLGSEQNKFPECESTGHGSLYSRRWRLIHSKKVEYRVPIRGRREIENTMSMIDCLKEAPMEWHIVIWLNASSFDSRESYPPCALADIKLIQGAAEQASKNSAGDQMQQQLMIWPPRSYSDYLHFHDPLDSVIVVRPQRKEGVPFSWLSSFERIYLRHALRKAYPLVQQSHALAEAYLENPRAIISMEHNNSIPESTNCRCQSCPKSDSTQNRLLRLSKTVVDAAHGKNFQRNKAADNKLLKLPGLRVATDLYEARFEDTWTKCNIEHGGCRSNLRKKLDNYDPLRDTKQIKYPAYSNKSYTRALHLGHKMQVVIVTASSIKGLRDRKTLAMMANKQAFAEAHGYIFELGISDMIIAAEGLRPTSTVIFRGEFCKILVLLASMRRHSSANWFMMADHDVWLHPMALKEASLDPWLLDIPKEKLFVHSNYHSLNTGVIFLRQGGAGRELVMKWWAVVNNSLVECHSWDQAAAQLLFLSQVEASTFPSLEESKSNESPFNFTCKAGRCGNFEKESFWSCDKAYRDSLRRALGSEKHSTLYQTGALSHIPHKQRAAVEATEFFILSESNYLPRLQCMHCQTIDAIDSPWGFNRPTLFGGLNGWLTTHKAMNRFAEYFTDMEDPQSPFRVGEKSPPRRRSDFTQRTDVAVGNLMPVQGFGFSSCPMPKSSYGCVR